MCIRDSMYPEIKDKLKFIIKLLHLKHEFNNKFLAIPSELLGCCLFLIKIFLPTVYLMIFFRVAFCFFLLISILWSNLLYTWVRLSSSSGPSGNCIILAISRGDSFENIIWYGVTPVSYTHLDVYKRQALGRRY